MIPLSLSDLERESASYDARVAESPDIDHFCSSSDWSLPAASGLLPGRAPWIRRGDHGYAALMVAEHAWGPLLQPLEAMWGLGCPLVGADPVALALELAGECERAAGGHALMICGLERTSPRFAALARALDPLYDLRLGPLTRRLAADLRGGMEPFLARRSPKFRTNLRSAQRKAAARGITFAVSTVLPGEADAAYERLLAVDAASWKGRSGAGVADSSMLEFYRRMIRRLAARGGARLGFARRDGGDVGYILGGVLGATYRGLQFAFATGYEDCSLGNLCQIAQIAALAAEGIAVYDLGADAEYKHRWGEVTRDTVTLLGFPRR
jgi:CelD/BcsL family acetyltransferase involved in cellulose biosynthesis